MARSVILSLAFLTLESYAYYYEHKPTPAPTPEPPISFHSSLGDFMVLQQAPSQACVYGSLASSASTVTVTVTVTDQSDPNADPYTVHAAVTGSRWRALLRPTPAHGNHTIQAHTSKGGSASLTNVLFGDVWYCAGQSNMALSLEHTFMRNKSIAAIRAGKYNQLRIHGIASNMNADQPWMTLTAAVREGTLLSYSATCYYFGESLMDTLGDESPPIGMVHTSFGGSTIEQWLDNETTSSCLNASQGDSKHTNMELYTERVLPYTDMSLKGWLWYQGENDMHGVHGNSLQGLGYGCLLPSLVHKWRSLWSATPHTTDPLAPFGVYTLAPAGSEGATDLGGFRWSQTANYGYLPNAVMPSTFLVQAFDMGDPYSDMSCLNWGCCSLPAKKYNATSCSDKTRGSPALCKVACAAQEGTQFYMGPIHSRLKKQLADRAAKVASRAVYGKKGAVTGPVISGCRLSKATLTVKFNQTLNGEVLVKAYNSSDVYSGFRVLTDASYWCLQSQKTANKKSFYCQYDGQTLHPSPINAEKSKNKFIQSDIWVEVDATQGKQPHTVDLDLGPLKGGQPVAVRYAWFDIDKPDTKTCCKDPQKIKKGLTCAPESCPVFGDGFPANPFIARIQNNKCECVPPQTCNE